MKRSVPCIALAVMLSIGSLARAENTLEKIEKSGNLTIGTRTRVAALRYSSQQRMGWILH